MRIRTMAGVLAGTLGILGGLLGGAAPAAAAPGDIHPGVMLFTDGAQCTANFIFEGGGATYIGYAAHCAGTGPATDTNGCTAASLPLGTLVEIDGATRPGVLAYSSWLTMQDVTNESDANTCAYNDFALVRIDPVDVASVSPNVPHWGGPNGVSPSGAPAGSTVYSYGNSSLRQGVTVLSPKKGVSYGTTGGGWTHPVTMAPAHDVPGDSGSGLLDANGRAIGVLSTLSVGTTGARSNYSDLSRALAYANQHGGLGTITMRSGTGFNGGQLPLALPL